MEAESMKNNYLSISLYLCLSSSLSLYLSICLYLTLFLVRQCMGPLEFPHIPLGGLLRARGEKEALTGKQSLHELQSFM